MKTSAWCIRRYSSFGSVAYDIGGVNLVIFITTAGSAAIPAGPAYVDLAVEGKGTEGLRVFVERINVVDRRIRPKGLVDVTLNWSEEVVTACAFDLFPNWIMLSWRIEGIGRGRSPSAALLTEVARAYRTALRSPTPPC